MENLLQHNLTEIVSNADVKALGSVLGTCVSAILGGDLPVFNALIALWALDFVLGFKRAWDCDCLSKKKAKNGFFKLVLYVVTAAVMGLAEYSMGSLGSYLSVRSLTISYLCLTEALSCLEHLSYFGVPIPEVIRNRLKTYRDSLHEGTLPQPQGGKHD